MRRTEIRLNTLRVFSVWLRKLRITKVRSPLFAYLRITHDAHRYSGVSLVAIEQVAQAQSAIVHPVQIYDVAA